MSEKPMTAVLRKSGIIDKHIAEFEKWRLVDSQDQALPASKSEVKTAGEMVQDLVDDIAQTLDAEPVMRQTLVAPVYSKSPPRLWSGQEVAFHAVKDEMGRLITDQRTKLYRGDVVWCEDAVHDNYTVLEVEDLYENDSIVAKMITIEKE